MIGIGFWFVFFPFLFSYFILFYSHPVSILYSVQFGAGIEHILSSILSWDWLF